MTILLRAIVLAFVALACATAARLGGTGAVSRIGGATTGAAAPPAEAGDDAARRVALPPGVAAPDLAAFSVVGLFRNRGNFNNCSVVRISPATGDNVTLANVTACAIISINYPAYSAADESTGKLNVVIATAPAIFSFDMATGEQSELAPLPAPYDQTDGYLGLVSAGGATFLITRTAIYSPQAGALVKLASGFAFPEIALVVASPGAGTGGAALVYVADEASTAIDVIDMGLTPPAISTTLQSSIASPWDMMYDATGDRLIVLAGYRLYAVNARTGKTTTLMNIPDGPGYPRTNGISPDGSVYFFADFSFLYTIDMAALKIVNKAPLLSAPRTMGFPVYSTTPL